MKHKYDVCIYTFDWETIKSFNTLEEAKKFAEKSFTQLKQDLAVFHGDEFITEYKP